MKPTRFLPLALIGAGLALAAWGYAPGNNSRFNISDADTVPRERKVRDLDDVIRELDEAELKLNSKELKQQMEEAMKHLDAEKIMLQAQKSMQSIDFEKIQRQIEESLAKLDIELNNKDLQRLNREERLELEKEMAKVKAEMKELAPRLQKELAEQKINMASVEKEMEKAAAELKEQLPKMEKEMENAREEMKKARETIKEYHAFVDQLEADGLLDREKGYSIKHKNGILTINGKEQPASVYNKYRSFLEKHKKFEIEKTDDDLDLDMD